MELASVLIITIGALAAVVACWGLGSRERFLALVAFAIHVIASFVQTWLHEVYYAGVSDAVGYQYAGQALAKILALDFWTFIPEVLKLGLHLESSLPSETFGEGSSTGTMSALAGLFEYITGSSSLLSLCLVTTWISWFGQLCWYRVGREALPGCDRTAAMVGFVFVPSVIFWGSAFAKEAITMGAFGLLGLSTYRVLRNGRLAYFFGIIFGITVVAAIKPYTLLPFVLACSTFFYFDRANRVGRAAHLRPLYVLVAILLSMSGVAALGSAFPEYSSSNIAQTVSTQQDAWEESGGGSTISRVGGQSLSVMQELELVPVALFNSLLRPTIFDVNNGPSFGAAIETTAVAVAIFLLFDQKSGVMRTVLSSPLLASSVVFIVVFGAAVGLTTSNLGSLSRYRVPMMPFFATVLLVLHQRRSEARRALRTARSRVVRRRSVRRAL
jgi:hypothetical protein